MDLYIFIADAWGAKYGGVNSFNYDLVIACSRVAKKNSNTKICCVVPCLSKQENEQMLKDGIIPITISKEAFKSPEAAQLIVEALADNSSLRPFFPNLCNSFCIGHDIYTGKLSKQIATKCDGWNIVFHHMDYRSYYLFKNADTVEFEKKEKEQESVLCDADLVCAVGPKLTESAEGITRCKEDLSVIEVYPGFANIKAIHKPDPRYRPIVFGRIEHDNQRIKQTELAVDAFAKAISLDDVYMAIGADATISVVGYDRNIPLENEVSNLQKKD